MAKDKNVAMILAIIAGAIGMHWIYLGKRFLSIFFITLTILVFSLDIIWLLIPFAGIGWINALRFAKINWNDFNTKYNRTDEFV